MDNVGKELHEMKVELDKIKDEYRIKTELLENLRKANNDQIVRYQEVKSQMEKMARELSKKEEESAESRRLYEDVKHRLQETESSLKSASCINEKLRIDSGEKIQKLEEENRKLVSALDEATLKINELEMQLGACREEVAGLKVLVLDSQKKCLEAEQQIDFKKTLSNRDDAIMKLEEECVDIQDRLKWKTEQFEHLEEAHKLLQENLQSSKQEWESEKTTLLQEISSLQNSLDTQARLNENLQSELKMCNQALAHEESRRRALENQLSESKLCFDNVLGEFNEAKSEIEKLCMERDEKVAALRNALGTKNAHVKEMEYKISHLEQENKELLCSVKELQEAQIGRKKPDSSFIKLRNKLRDLEQTHNRCSTILEEREAEWNVKMESLTGQVTRYEFDLKTKSEEINQLKLQVESCQSSVDISGEETSILLMVLKSAYAEVYSKLLDLKLEIETQKEDGQEKLAASDEQNRASESQLKAQLCLEQAAEEIKALSKKLEALKMVESKNTSLVNELDKCRKMLDESSVCQLRLEEHAALMEASSKQMRDAVTDFQKEKAQLENEWKRRELLARSGVEKLKKKMEKLEHECMDASVSSFSEMFEMLTKNGALREALRNAEYLIAAEVDLKTEKVESLKMVENKNKSLKNELDNCRIMLNESSVCQLRLEEHAALMEASNKQTRDAVADLQKEKAQLEKEWKRREVLARSDMEKLEHELMDASVSSFSVIFEMLTKNGALSEAMENAEYLVDLQKEKLEILKTVENKNKSLEIELEKGRKMLDASSVRQLRLEEHAALMEASNKKTRGAVVDLQKEKARLENELKRRELQARSDMEIIKTLEQNLIDASVSLFSETFEMLTEKCALKEALEKEFSEMRSEIANAEESVLHSQSRVKELEALLEQKDAEMEIFKGERECLVAYIDQVDKQIEGFQEDDVMLMGMLDKMQGHCEEDEMKLTEGNVDQMKDNSCFSKGKVSGNLDRKVCPLRELN